MTDCQQATKADSGSTLNLPFTRADFDSNLVNMASVEAVELWDKSSVSV